MGANASARRVDEVDAEVFRWIEVNVMSEGLVKRVLAEVRKRIAKQGETKGRWPSAGCSGCLATVP